MSQHYTVYGTCSPILYYYTYHFKYFLTFQFVCDKVLRPKSHSAKIQKIFEVTKL